MTSQAQARLERHATHFPTPDVDAAVAYYGTVLGFEAEYVAGSPAEFAIVSRPQMNLARTHRTPPARRASGVRSSRGSAPPRSTK
jgi:catechol 2,3-dioxygenase-like lactoylglutathione lyase family enzyme